MYDVGGRPLQGPDLLRQATEASQVLAWYDRSRRVLPWRALPGQRPYPYAVWLSEIMLQQTTVAAVKPYFTAFLQKWPKIEQLAEASTEEVMRQWAGLGYYSRARNLHACAKTLAKLHGGHFPRNEPALRALPGIGPYTAAAIAAIAFDQRAVVVDGNIERVIARLFAIDTPLPTAKGLIKQKADALTPFERPGDYAQAMMDLGATLCTPRRPACAICPLHESCAALAQSAAEAFPKKAAKPPRPLRRGAVFFIRRTDGAVLVRTRSEKGLLGGMTEIPSTEWRSDFTLETATGQAPLAASYRLIDQTVEHVFTHFALRLYVYFGEVGARTLAPQGSRFVTPAKLDLEAFPSVMRKIIELVRKDQSDPRD
jgi:A/G-specific adenine glycosylase